MRARTIVLYNKYFVDELYDATFIKGTMKSAFGLWTFDRRVVDGAVNGSGWLTVFASWVSSLIDRYVVDGAVNLVGPLVRGIELRVPPRADRTDSELRAADAGRRMRVCEHLLAREVVP